MDKKEKCPTYRDLTKGRRMVRWRGLWAAVMGSVPAPAWGAGVRGKGGRSTWKVPVLPQGQRADLADFSWALAVEELGRLPQLSLGTATERRA